ncbi:hypothetical protein CTY88_03945 [Acinetobacter seifertii]|nr:hypothetical protein [Acinetobacter seifertii]
MAIDPAYLQIGWKDPSESFLQGLNSALQTQNNFNAVKANQLEEERKKQAFLQQQVRNEDLYKFSLIPNKTADDYSSIISRYPDLAEPYQKAWGILDAGQQQQTLNTASQVYAALHSNQKEVAKDIVREQIQAYDNSGKKSESNQMKMILGLIDKSPEAAASSVGMLMSSVSPDKFKDILLTLGGEQRANEMQPYQIKDAQAKIAETQARTGLTNAQTQGQNINNQYAPAEKQWNIANIKSQIDDRSGRLKLDRDALETNAQLKLEELGQSNAKLDPSVVKLVNDSIVDSSAAQLLSNQQFDLANQFESKGGGVGRFSSWSERFKEFTGNQDSYTELRNSYVRIKNSIAMKSLPPGSASDADISLAMKGMPPGTADAKTIASFLRGMAKMSQREAAYKQMQAEWANQNGNLGTSKKDLSVLGVSVPRGTSFNRYYQANLNRVLKDQENQNIQQQVATGQASYMSVVK